MRDLLASLNPAQREAVTAPAGPLLILAGAGSGKTRALTYRIAHLMLAEGHRPESLVGLTFTNKAAETMRERVAGLIGAQGHGVRLSTFHSLGARLLRRYAGLAGLPAGFVILDEDDSLALTKEALKGLSGGRDLAPGQACDRISRAKAEGLDPAALRGNSPGTEVLAAAYERYEDAKRRLGAVDFDDLIGLPIRLLEETPAAEEIRAGIAHVLVDEYQDTSPAQYRLLRALAGKNRHVTCVGDPDQSIYRWRGADIRNILEFERDFPEARIIKMEQNYRSTGNILAAASSVISRNLKRKPKALWTEGPPGAPLVFYQAMDETDEARMVAERAGQIVQGTADARRFAVLYRTHAQSRVLEEAFALRNIPYVLVGGVKFYARREVKDMLSYARLLANPADQLSLVRAFASPPRGVGPATLDRLKAAAESGARPALEILADKGFQAGLPPRTRNSVRGFLEFLERMGRTSSEEGFAAALALAVEESGYLEWLDKRGGAEAQDRRANLRELLGAAQAAQEGGASLAEFLERAALLADIDRWDDARPYVTLMTLHNAKGLEFGSVCICGLEEGLLPHASSLDDDEELEEERRLFYVGMTRARESLLLTAARGRRMYERFQWGRNSRFLSELPRENLVTMGTTETPGSGGSSRPAPEKSPASWDFEGEPAFRRGERVRHDRFGTGQVLSLFGSGEETRVLVHFPGYGRKTFLARMAHLARIEEAA